MTWYENKNREFKVFQFYAFFRNKIFGYSIRNEFGIFFLGWWARTPYKNALQREKRKKMQNGKEELPLYKKIG